MVRFLLIRKDGTILCNVESEKRARELCEKVPDVCTIVTTDWARMERGFMAQCARYGWTLERDTADAEARRNWLKSPIYGRGGRSPLLP